MDYPVYLADQLPQHLRSLRKARGLTQARLAALLGVTQSRVAQIEGNPGTVSVDQLFKTLSALQVQLVLRDKDSRPAETTNSTSPQATLPLTDVKPHTAKGAW